MSVKGFQDGKSLGYLVTLPKIKESGRWELRVEKIYLVHDSISILQLFQQKNARNFLKLKLVPKVVTIGGRVKSNGFMGECTTFNFFNSTTFNFFW